MWRMRIEKQELIVENAHLGLFTCCLCGAQGKNFRLTHMSGCIFQNIHIQEVDLHGVPYSVDFSWDARNKCWHWTAPNDVLYVIRQTRHGTYQMLHNEEVILKADTLGTLRNLIYHDIERFGG